jgi:hypothetical protein
MKTKMQGAVKWSLIGIPIIFLLGSLFHFTYEFSGENLFVGLFSAVNESVWEHLKLLVLPMILWWGGVYFFKGKEFDIDKKKWFSASVVALLSAIITVPLLFYFYTEAFDTQSLVVDILIFLIAVIVGQLVGIHFYKNSKGMDLTFSYILIILIVFIFIYFTLFPPQIPLFLDPVSNTYGLQ